MKSNFGVFACTAVTFGFLMYACASGEVVDGPATGTAGAGSPQGTAGTGNPQGAAGTTGNADRGGTTGGGNQVGTGGAANQTGRGGTTGTGNTVGTAGTTGTGNTVGTAGTTGTGNTVGTAGTTGTGNTVGTAGTTGSAGSTGSCPSTFMIAANGYVQAPGASGTCLHGYAFAGGDAGSTITPKDFATCGASCMLKMSGSVGAATAANNYAGNAYLGFSVGQDSSGSAPATIKPKGSSLTVTFTATTGGLPLRLQLAADTTGAVFWCYTITSPASGSVTVPYAMFNKACWDNSGAAYANEAFMSLEMSVPGGAMATSGVSVAITGVKENP
jgi:hypothetical protein